MKTRRQQKHELLLTFMENVKAQKQRKRRLFTHPKFLTTFLSLFL